MSVDSLMGATYNRDTYNCAHFLGDAWEIETGQDIRQQLGIFLQPKTKIEAKRAFKRIEKPQSPCIVLMRRPNTEPHVGMYLRGKVLHLHENGAEYMPVSVACRGFKTIGYYVC